MILYFTKHFTKTYTYIYINELGIAKLNFRTYFKFRHLRFEIRDNETLFIIKYFEIEYILYCNVCYVSQFRVRFATLPMSTIQCVIAN